MVVFCRIRLSWRQKRMIIEEHLRRGVNGNSNELQSLCNWAKKKMNLPCAPSRNTIKRITTNQEIVNELSESISQHQNRRSSVTSQLLEEHLSD